MKVTSILNYTLAVIKAFQTPPFYFCIPQSSTSQPSIIGQSINMILISPGKMLIITNGFLIYITAFIMLCFLLS